MTPIAVGDEVSVTAIGGTANMDKSSTWATARWHLRQRQLCQRTLQSKQSRWFLLGRYKQFPVDAIDPSRAYVATTAGLFILNSGGQVGGLDEPGPAANPRVTVMSTRRRFRSSTVNHLVSYATTAIPNLLYKTSDAGASWQQLNPAYPGEPVAGAIQRYFHHVCLSARRQRSVCGGRQYAILLKEHRWRHDMAATGWPALYCVVDHDRSQQSVYYLCRRLQRGRA